MSRSIFAATAALSFSLAFAAAPLAAGELAFEPVAPKGISADRVAGVEKFQASIGASQLAAMETQGYGAYGAIAIPVAKRGNPLTMANLPDRGAAEAAVLDACKAETGTACTVIGFLVPAGG